MKYILGILSILFLTQPYSASAFLQFTEYRILGNEIKSVELEPLEHESEHIMHITLKDGSGESGKITILSDDDLSKCKEDIERIVGDQNVYAQIIVHENADSLNGVWTIQCTVLYFNNY